MRLEPPLLGLLLFAAPVAAAGDAVPRPLVVEVVWAEEPGPESVRDDLEREVSTRLRRAECFAAVSAPGDDDERPAEALGARISLSDYEEETRFLESIGDLHSPNRPPGAGRNTSTRVRARIRIESLGPDGVRLKERRIAPTVRYASRLDESSRDHAVDDFLDTVSLMVARHLCRPSAAKWARWIENARR